MKTTSNRLASAVPRLPAVFHYHQRMTHLFDQTTGHQLIDGVVFGQQDVQRLGRPKALQIRWMSGDEGPSPTPIFRPMSTPNPISKENVLPGRER